MGRLLRKAWDFYKEILQEYESAKDDPTLLRDVCEKGWGVVVEATNALFEKLNFKPLPKSTRDRTLAFDELEKRNEWFRSLAIGDRVTSSYYILYELGFRQGSLTTEEIKTELEKVKEFIKLVEKV